MSKSTIATNVARAYAERIDSRCAHCGGSAYLDWCALEETPTSNGKRRVFHSDCWDEAREMWECADEVVGAPTKYPFTYWCHVEVKDDTSLIRAAALDAKSTPWYLVDGGYASPTYRNMHWHKKLTPLAAATDNATVTIEVYFDGCHVGTAVARWSNRDEAGRFCKKGAGIEEVLDNVERICRGFRPKQRKLPEDFK